MKHRITVSSHTLEIERGKAGLIYATCPDVPGLLLAKQTVREIADSAVEAISQMRTARDQKA